MIDSRDRTKRRRWSVATATIAFVGVLVSGAVSQADITRRLSAQTDANRMGLTRAWFTQVQVDPSRNDVDTAVLLGDRLTVLTSAGVLQELDAHTGRTLWLAPVGNPDHPSLGPVGNDKHVSLIKGSTLYVLDRTDGRPVKVQVVGGAPGAAPAVAASHVFVPLFTGRLEGYSLEKESLTPWYYQSSGRALVTPLATEQSFVWTTDNGHLYVGGLPDLKMRYRLETPGRIIAQPSYRKPYVYLATEDGEVFAMHELTGARRWKYATGYPVVRSPAAVGDSVFVTSDEPALHCIDAERGIARWEAPGIKQFAALSGDRVYGIDELGRLVALDAKTGAVVGRMATDYDTNALVNDQSDRIYLVSNGGLVQCLHEIGRKEPVDHRPKAKAAEQSGEASAGIEENDSTEESATESGAADEPSPFEGTDAEATEEGEATETAPSREQPPFEADDENPFDF